MFGNTLRIEVGPDWQVNVATESWLVATLLVAALLLAILLASVICYYVTRSIMLLIVSRLARKEGRKWMIAAERHRVFHRLAPLVPAAIVYASAPLLSGLTFPIIPALGRPLAILAACYMVYTLVRAALALRDSIDERYSHFPSASERPIKSFLQIATIVVYLIALIAVVSLVLERSPLYLLTGLSAITALLIIIFRDSLLGFVASIQLAAYDMLRVGDWIEVPGYVADGIVVDIALNTIKVRNFDNTIVMLPSQLLLTNSVKNWRGMIASGARRLRHAIHFDVDTIRFPDDASLARLREAIERPLAVPEGDRRTNLGLYRLYLSGYFREHPAVRRDMPLVIRHVQSATPSSRWRFAFLSTKYVGSDTRAFSRTCSIMRMASCRCSACVAGSAIARRPRRHDGDGTGVAGSARFFGTAFNGASTHLASSSSFLISSMSHRATARVLSEGVDERYSST